MDLKIRAQIDETDLLYVRIGQRVWEITYDAPSAKVSIPNPDGACIKIEQAQEEKEYGLWGIIFFICTFIPRALINVFLLNTAEKWYKDIKPYRVMGYLCLTENTPQTLHIKITNSKICSNWHKYKKPIIEIKPFVSGGYKFVLDEQSFKNGFWMCLKNLLAFYLLGGGFFLITTVLSLLSSKIFLAWLFSTMFFVVTICVLWRIRVEYKRFLSIVSFYRSISSEEEYLFR